MQLFVDHLRLSIKIASRNFRKHFLYGSLNILGLSIAFATFILVSIYLYQETSYESFHSKADRIYRPTYHVKAASGFEAHFARIPNNFVNHLPTEIPEIEQLIRFQNKEQKYLRIGENRFKPKHAYVTDAAVFSVFDFELIEGDPTTALVNPMSIVLTESLAKKYFSTTKILDKEIVVTGDYSDEEKIFKVTGVMKDLPINTHLPVEMLFSFESEKERSGWAYVYTLLSKEAKIDDVQKKIPDFIKKYANGESELSYDFQALRDIHLQSHLAREIQPNGQLLYIKIFFWIGLFIWLIALVNFTNLNTALAMNRGKEVGVCKILGASSKSLILMTLSEALFYVLTALLIGGVISFLLYPAFSHLTGVGILPPMVYFIPLLFGVALISGLLGGLFPLIILNTIQVLQVIKQGNNWSLKKRSSGINLKRVLITLQFCVTLILIASALFAHSQLAFINEKNLGLQTEQIIAIPDVPDNVKNKYLTFKNQVNALSGVRQVAACMQMPSSEIRDVGPVTIKGQSQENDQRPMMDMQIIDPDFMEMMQIELLAGVDFTLNTALVEPPTFSKELTVPDYLNEAPRSYFINETAMKQLGWDAPEAALNQEINWSIGPYQLAHGPVKGVIKDYHQETLKNKVDPLVMTVEPIWLSNFLIKVETTNISKTITEIENIWNDLFPYVLEYHFLDELYNRLYKQDQVQLQLLSILTIIAILISFIGLISLVAFSLKRRSKELAIRRVIGADLKTLTTLIGKEYFWILLIAAIIGIPISYWGVSKWLENFAYQITLSPFIYFISIFFLLLLISITIYFQTFRATTNNPINILRED